MDRSTTAREIRARHKAEVSRVLVNLLAEHDVTQAELAQVCGVRPGIVQRWCDRERLETPTAADIASMPEPIAVGLTRWAMHHHDMIVAPAAEAESISDDVQHLATVVRETSEATSAYAQALADGTIGPDEAAHGLREVQQAESALATLRHRYEQVLRQRGAKALRSVPGGSA